MWIIIMHSLDYTTMQFYDDKNVTLIEEKRFNREHCDDACFHNYSMTDLVYWGVNLGCWNEVTITHVPPLR